MSELVALLDLGSNAARFVLVRIRPGRGFTVVEEARVQTRLADGRHGRLPAPAVHKTLRAVHAFMEPTRGRHHERLTVCGQGVRHGVLVEETFGRVTPR